MKKLLPLLFLISPVSFAGSFAVDVVSQASFIATTQSRLALAADVKRNYLFIENNGSDVVMITFGKAQVGQEGIQVQPNVSYEPMKTPRDAVYIQSASGSQNLVILTGY